MQTKQCLTDQDLTDFDLGNLAGERYEEVSLHLESCAECSRRFGRLDQRSDDLLENLKQKLPREILDEDSEVNRLIDAAAALRDTIGADPFQTRVEGVHRTNFQFPNSFPELLAPPQADDELGRLGGYRVLSVLGRGGMGVVFKAEDPALKRLVALKAMLPNVAASSDSARARFLREAQATAAIHHDHIVTIHQVGQDGDVPFLAMQLLEGESLAMRLGREGRLPIPEACRIPREIATGLAAAHAKGLIHRDIKPDNIWLEGMVEGLELRVEGENTGTPALNSQPSTLNRTRVKILDFGLARANDEDAQLTQSGAVVGTPSYLAPEQGLGQAVDARADLFSLGVVLYQMLTDQKPFHRDSIIATLRAIDSETPQPPSQLRDDVPHSLSELVMRLMEKKPDKRPASATELVRAIRTIEESLNESPVAARPVVVSHKALPRWRVLIATAAAIAVVVLAGIIIKIRDKDGKVIATIEAPEGVTVETESDSKPQPTNTTAAELGQQTYLPPMSPTAFVQRPPKLAAKDGEDVKSWTVLPVGVQSGSASALSFDGQLLAAFGNDGAVRVWDVEKKALHKVLIGHVAGPCTPAGKPSDRTNWGYNMTNSRRFGPLAWRPTADGKSSWLATVSRDGSVRVWDVEKGTTVWKDVRDGDLINMLAWSPDGTKLAVGYDDGQVRTWEADGGKELKSLSLAEGPPFSLGWSPDSKRLAVHSSSGPQAGDGVVVVWDVTSGKQQRLDSTGIGWTALHANHPQGISAMRWSLDGTQLAVKEKESLRIYETVEWKPTHRLTSGQKDNLTVQDFDWSPDGTTLLVSWNGQLQMHDLKAGKATAVPQKDKQLAIKIEWAPGSSRVALFNQGGVFSYSAILDTQKMDPPSLPLGGGGYIHEFSSDGTRLLSGAYIPVVIELDADKVVYWQLPHQPALSQRQGAPVWSPDGQWVSHGTSFWKSQEKDWAKSRWTLPIDSIVSWSPDSKRFLAYAGVSGIEHELWSPHDRKPLAAFEQNHGLFAASWSPDGSQFAMGSGGEVVVRNGTSGQILRRWKAAVDPNEPGQVPSIAWSRRGDRMAVSYDSGAYVIDAADGKPRFALASGYPRMLWGPDDRRLLVVGVQELSVFEGGTGKYQTGFALPANSRAIHFLDHDKALCGTRDGFVHRLDLATGKHEVVTKGLGNIIEISPDGQQLAVDHGGLSIHSSDGRLQTSFLSPHENEPFIISADGHFWSNDQAQGPFWATKGNVPTTLVYIVQTASGQQTLTPAEFASRYGWQNDPSKVRLK